MSTFTGGTPLARGPMGGDSYTMVHRGVFRDANISAKAKGIFGYLSTHVDGWRVSEKSIAKAMKDGRDAIRAGLRELEEHCYLIRGQERGEGGTWGASVWFYTDLPAQIQALGIDDAELVAANVSEAFGEWQKTRSAPLTENPSSVVTSENVAPVGELAEDAQVGERLSRSAPLTGFPSTDNPRAANPPHKESKDKEITLEGTNPPPPPPRSSAERESGQATDGGGGGVDPFNETLDDIFREFVLGLPWDRTPTVGQLDRMSRMVQAALNPGWTLGMLRRELVAELDGVRSRYAVWKSRLSRLPEEPLEVPRGVPLPGASSGALPPVCGQCEAPDDRAPALWRKVPIDPTDPDSAVVPCPRCHPSMINNQEDQS